MPEKVIIIGGGIAGLTAGCHLKMNGFDAEIFEQHALPGGLCTSWERKGYTIDGCIHWLVGSAPSDAFYFLWNELIDMKKMDFVDFDIYMQVENEKGEKFTIYCDINKLEQEMLRISPEDEYMIKELSRLVRKFSRFTPPIQKPFELMRIPDYLKIMRRVIPYMNDLRRYLKIPADRFAAQFKNPLIRKGIESIFETEMATLFLIFTLSWMNKRSAGFPVGGSLNFARKLEAKFLQEGGIVHYKSKVDKILTQKNDKNEKACGIRLTDGSIHQSDIVISTADLHSTIFNMLDGKFLHEKITDLFTNHKPFPAYFQVSLGVAKNLDEFPPSLVFPLKQPIELQKGETIDSLHIRIMNFDKTLAPEGKTNINTLITTTEYTYWEELRKTDYSSYQKQKQQIAKQVVDAIKEKLNLAETDIEMIDISTPATVLRYTSNWHGSYEGWLLTPKIGLSRIPKMLPGLDNFYLAGHWVEPGGGLPSALHSGRQVVQLICHSSKQRFVSKQL